uniref:H15 domain-containing protein n=1 Tax=Timema douglasi TaxID=61478 RepID=A0A7R8ZA64_TIMDO|nr:unnamed protein product [Timema douglasi]
MCGALQKPLTVLCLPSAYAAPALRPMCGGLKTTKTNRDEASKENSSPTPEEEPGPSTSHPPTSTMVLEAIVAKANKGGVSVQAIKKFIAEKYLLDIKKYKIHIKTYLSMAVISGEVIQVSGKGFSGKSKRGLKKKAHKKTADPKKPSPATTKGLDIEGSSSKNTTKINKTSRRKPLYSVSKERDSLSEQFKEKVRLQSSAEWKGEICGDEESRSFSSSD